MVKVTGAAANRLAAEIRRPDPRFSCEAANGTLGRMPRWTGPDRVVALCTVGPYDPDGADPFLTVLVIREGFGFEYGSRLRRHMVVNRLDTNGRARLPPLKFQGCRDAVGKLHKDCIHRHQRLPLYRDKGRYFYTRDGSSLGEPAKTAYLALYLWSHGADYIERMHALAALAAIR